MNLIDGQYLRGSAFMLLGLSYIGITIVYYKKDKAQSKK
jgi:hypothetical protein